MCCLKWEKPLTNGQSWCCRERKKWAGTILRPRFIGYAEPRIKYEDWADRDREPKLSLNRHYMVPLLVISTASKHNDFLCQRGRSVGLSFWSSTHWGSMHHFHFLCRPNYCTISRAFKRSRIQFFFSLIIGSCLFTYTEFVRPARLMMGLRRKRCKRNVSFACETCMKIDPWENLWQAI